MCEVCDPSHFSLTGNAGAAGATTPRGAVLVRYKNLKINPFVVFVLESHTLVDSFAIANVHSLINHFFAKKNEYETQNVNEKLRYQ